MLSLDADERVTAELAEAIGRILSAPPEDVNGFVVYRRVYYRDKWLRHGGFYPEKQLRLFRAEKGVSPIGPFMNPSSWRVL